MKYLRRYSIIIIVSIIIGVFFSTQFVGANHFNIITVNSVFAGFLFTSLSIILGFINEEIVQFFERADCLKKVYDNISLGIQESLLSIIIAILNMVVFENFMITKKFIKFLYSLEITFLIFAIWSFIITLLNVKILINSIRDGKKKEAEKKEANQKMLEVLKKDN